MKNTLIVSIVAFVLFTGLTHASTVAEAVAAAPGSEVTINDALILSTTDLAADSGYRSFQLRDVTRAITVYGTNAEIEAALTDRAAGDGINITGIIATAGGAFRLEPPVGGSVSGFAVSGRTSTVPFPFPTNALIVSPIDIGQPYESDLVCLQNVSFDSTGVFAAGNNYTLVGGGAVIRIATDQLGLAGLVIPSGPLNITGIVIPDPLASVGSYCLAPRGMSDIVMVPEPATLAILGLGGLGLLRRRYRADFSRGTRQEHAAIC